MANTTNYNFKKPLGSEFFNIVDQNNNWDINDAVLKAIETATATNTSDLENVELALSSLADGQTADQILAKLKTVDVNDSGINATTVQGYTPVNKAGDTVTGALKFNRGVNLRDYKDAFHWHADGTLTGTLKIVLPFGWSNCMIGMTIKGYSYQTPSSMWELKTGAYMYIDTTSWYNAFAGIVGDAPFSKVRMGYSDGKCVLLLGTTATVWSYSSLVVDLITSFQSVDGWETGWSASVIESEAGITNIVEPEFRKAITGKSGIGSMTTASWFSYTAVAGYTHAVNVNIANITSTDFVEVFFPTSATLSLNHFNTAKNAGIDYVDTGAGYVTFLAKAVPAYNLEFKYQIKSGV